MACMCFPRKLQNFIIFLGKIKRISALQANIGSFQQRLGKYLLFPHQVFVYWAKVCLKTRYTSFFIVIRSSLKCIRKNPVRWIQKNLKTLIGTVTMSQVKLVNAIPLPWSEWFRSYFFTQHKTFSKITHQIAWTEAQPKQHRCFQSRSYKIWSC